MTQYTIDPNALDRQLVGEIDIENVYRLISVQIPESACQIWIYPGLIKHVKKHHPGVFEGYHHLIPQIIKSPDFIGRNPKEPDSIELYKKVDESFLLAIKLDPSGYLFIASFYDLNNAQNKITKRLKTGRIVPYTEKP